MPSLAHLYINGKFVPSSNGETFLVRNPFSGEIVTESASASSADCKAAVDAAAEALKTWETSSMTTRRDIFLRAAELVKTDKYRQKIMESNLEETAAAPYWGMYNWATASNTLRTQAGLVDQLRGETYPSATLPGADVITERRPMGVVFGIAPWNAPFALSLRAIGVPIICGNTAVLKSSEFSPRSQSIVAELFDEAGLPHGVLNFISISKENAPALTAEIIAHPAVQCINFTGSDRVGKIIATEAAKYLKPCILELGGKAPAIVLNDANVAEAARCIVSASMTNSGQVCMATSRVIVQSGIAENLTSAIQNIIQTFKAGDVQSSTTSQSANMGALFSEGSATNAVAMVKEAQADGAEVLLGNISSNGAVIQPHLVKNVAPGMRLWDREVFGPVLSIAVFETVDEAVALANTSDYSLSASVYSADVWAARKLASRIRSGYTNINGPSIHSESIDGLVGLGGASGYGRFNIEGFSHKTVIVVHPAGRRLHLVD